MQNKKLKTITLTINSDLEQVELIGNCINKLCDLVNYDDLQSYDIELCCVEAVNNCIKHAYNNIPDNLVQVIFTIYESFLEIQVIDNGKTADNLNFNNHFEMDIEKLDGLPEGGMGLFLINQIMNNVSYIKEKDKNILLMTKDI